MRHTAAHPQVANAALTIGLCLAVAVLEGFDIQAIGVVAPQLAPALGLSPDQMGWVFSISNIGLVLGASLGGWSADRFGRKPVLIGSVLIFGTFTLLTALAGNFGELFAARLLAGVGFGAALPNMMAIAAEISAPGSRATTAATMFCGMPLGGGIAALTIQLLPAGFDWRFIFVIGGLLPLLVAGALYAFMPETLAHRGQRSEARTPVMGALFGEGRAWPTLLLWVTFLPTLLMLYLFLNWLPTLVVANGLDRAIAPQASLAFNFASVAGALTLGRLVDRFEARWPLSLAYGALIVVLLALAGARELVPILVLSGAAGFLLMGANFSLYGVAAAYYPAAVRGTGSGASIAVGRVGSISGPLVAGLLLGSGVSAGSVVQYLAPAAATACIAVFLLGSFRRVD
jgi:MFS transporter, AAHS family, 3-hydroxyphenylpropionic acid transporter